MAISVTLHSAQSGACREVTFAVPELAGMFKNEDGAVAMISMEKLASRITRDRGGMSSLIENLDALNDAFRQIDQGRPLLPPVLNSRRRSIATQLLVESGRSQLYALRSRGADSVPMIVPQGLLLQVEMELGLDQFGLTAGVRADAAIAPAATQFNHGNVA